MNLSTITGPYSTPATPPAAAASAAEARSIEDPNKPITAAMLADLMSGGPTASGENVNETTSMRLGTVWACVRAIAHALARMPLIVYERTDRGRERRPEHPLSVLLHQRPNPMMSSFSWRVAKVMGLLLGGDGFSEIVRRGDGRVQQLLPLQHNQVEPFRVAGELRYRVWREDGEKVILLARDVLHIPCMAFDGVRGLSVIKHARQTIGAALAQEKWNAGFYARGCRASGVLEHPAKLGTDAISNLRTSWQIVYGGADNTGKPIILEEGMKWNAAPSISPEDAQFVETSQMRTEDICRWFGVPPHKVGHLLRATNNNIEQQSLDFLSDTVAPWAEAFEQEMNWKLLLPEERGKFYIEHLTQAIIAMDANARGQLYERMMRIGAMTPDEVRDRENLNRYEHGRGAYPWIQSSHMPLPTAEQSVELVDSWIKKGAGPGGANGPGDGSGKPDPATDDKVAKSG